MIGRQRRYTVRAGELDRIRKMGHQPVETLFVQHVGLQGPVGPDTLRRAERSVAVAVAEKTRLIVPQVLVDVTAQLFHLVLHLLDLLPPLDVETDVQQGIVDQHLLQVGVEPYHMAV